MPCRWRALLPFAVLCGLTRPVAGDASATPIAFTPMLGRRGRSLSPSTAPATIKGTVTFVLSQVPANEMQRVMNASLANYFEVYQSDVKVCDLTNSGRRLLEGLAVISRGPSSERRLQSSSTDSHVTNFQVQVPASQAGAASDKATQAEFNPSAFGSVMQTELQNEGVGDDALASFTMKAFSAVPVASSGTTENPALDPTANQPTVTSTVGGTASGSGATTTGTQSTARSSDSGATFTTTTVTWTGTDANGNLVAPPSPSVDDVVANESTGFFGGLWDGVKDSLWEWPSLSTNPWSWRFWLQIALVALPCLALLAVCASRGRKKNTTYRRLPKFEDSQNIVEPEDTSCIVEDHAVPPTNTFDRSVAVAEPQGRSMNWTSHASHQPPQQQQSWGYRFVPRFAPVQHHPPQHNQPVLWTAPPRYVQAPTVQHLYHHAPMGSVAQLSQPLVSLDDSYASGAYLHHVASSPTTHVVSPPQSPQASLGHSDPYLPMYSPVQTVLQDHSSGLAQPLQSMQPMTTSAQAVLSQVQRQTLAGTSDVA